MAVKGCNQERDAYIVSLATNPEMTYNEIGEKVGVSGSRVYQIFAEGTANRRPRRPYASSNGHVPENLVPLIPQEEPQEEPTAGDKEAEVLELYRSGGLKQVEIANLVDMPSSMVFEIIREEDARNGVYRVESGKRERNLQIAHWMNAGVSAHRLSKQHGIKPSSIRRIHRTVTTVYGPDFQLPEDRAGETPPYVRRRRNSRKEIVPVQVTPTPANVSNQPAQGRGGLRGIVRWLLRRKS